MNILKSISSFFDLINKITGSICAFFAASMVLVVLGVVVLRYGFSISFIWMQEAYVWLHAYIFMMGSGYTYLSNEHVRIDVFYRGASVKYKSIVDILGNLFLLIPFIFVIWKFSFPFIARSWSMNEVSREVGGLPALYILKSAILIFCILLFIQALSNIIKSIIHLTSKESS
ncbi:MAG: TRAP transporter small permease subunit [Alphaproteobacteria bacterium]|nr:TRAP transporter small permease subunit [Alphaproteobacteria bacterium]